MAFEFKNNSGGVGIYDSPLTNVQGNYNVFNNIGQAKTPTANSDVGSIIEQIRQTVLVMLSEKKAVKEQNEAAQLMVYRALSIHPAISHMYPPSDVLADLDWYTEMRAPVLSSVIFGNLGKNEHFKRLSQLGETGTRTRIILLLCWVLGHRLPKDRIKQLLSTALHDALGQSGSNALMDSIQNHLSVHRVLGDIAKMIKTRLPLPASYNPFYGVDYVAADEDKVVPRDELWAYRLPEDQRYEFDVKRNPSILLRGLSGRVLIPQTKLSLLCVVWLSRNFGLGHKVYSEDDVVPDAFWNADPPARVSKMQPALYLKGRTDESQAGAPEGWAVTTPTNLEEALRLLTVEEWIHERYCCIYPIHYWVHNPITRCLLLNTFVMNPVPERLPCLREVVEASRTAVGLQDLFPSDIWGDIMFWTITNSMSIWADSPTGGDPVSISTTLHTSILKCMTVIFTDPAHLIWKTIGRFEISRPFSEFFIFLVTPHLLYPNDVELSRIPLIRPSESQLQLTNRMPPVDPDSCTCCHCTTTNESVWKLSRFFVDQYDNLMSNPVGCGALMDTCNMAMQDAEDWLETLMGRCVSPIDLLPSNRRLGPLILDLLNIMRIPLGEELDSSTLLPFLTALRFYNLHHLPGSLIIPSARSSDNLIGYITKIGALPDYEDYDFDNLLSNQACVLSTQGGWLFQLPDNGLEEHEAVISFLFPASDGLLLTPRLMPPLLIDAIYMPELKADVPILITPRRHDNLISCLPPSPLPELQCGELILDRSQLLLSGYPALSVSPQLLSTEASFDGVCGGQLVTCVSGRLIQSWWRPNVISGHACQHTSSHRRLDRCSFACAEILLQVDYPDPVFLRLSAKYKDSNDPINQDHQLSDVEEHIELFKYEHKRRTARITERGGPFEAQRLCFIRCNDTEETAIEAIVILAGSLGKRVYVIHAKECVECALNSMRQNGCTVGLFTVLDSFSACETCVAEQERTINRIEGIEQAAINNCPEGKHGLEKMVQATMKGFRYMLFSDKNPIPPELRTPASN